MAAKERHNITISPKIWKTLQLLGRRQNKSVSELLETAACEMLKSKSYNSVYLKIMGSVETVDDAENMELTQLLDELTADDLEVVETYRLS